jgi:hypothetical protein
MGRKKEYILEEVNFSGKAFHRENRIVRNHKTVGALFLPDWMIGTKFDIILIPHNEEGKNQERKEDN